MHMVDSKYSLKLKNTLKPENKCIDAKKCQFLFVMQYWRINFGTLSPSKLYFIFCVEDRKLLKQMQLNSKSAGVKKYIYPNSKKQK